MARLLIEDVTLVRSPEQVTAHIRFKGGAIHVAVQRWKTDPREVAMAQQLLEDHHDDASIAQARAERTSPRQKCCASSTAIRDPAAHEPESPSIPQPIFVPEGAV